MRVDMDNGKVGIVRDSLLQPRQVPIYCSGLKTAASFNWVERKWTCGRCGANVKVTW
jgi:hypothetical protein